MLSHCLPRADGSPAQRRAWQLLCLGSRRHRLHLHCLADQRLHLRDWRRLRPLVASLHIVPRARHWRAAAWLERRGLTLLGQSWIGALLASALAGQPGRTTCDALLCTHPALVQPALRLQAQQRICDLAPLAPRSALSPRLAAQACAHSQIVLLAQADQLELVPVGGASRVILPPGLLDLFNPSTLTAARIAARASIPLARAA